MYKHKDQQNKLKWYHLIDYKRVLKNVLPFTIFIPIIYFTYKPNNTPRNYDKYDKVTVGIVHEIKPLETFSQGFDGLNKIKFAYQAKYSFRLKDELYQGKMMISTGNSNDKLIGYIKRNLNKKKYRIKYMSHDPEKSILDVKNIDPRNK